MCQIPGLATQKLRSITYHFFIHTNKTVEKQLVRHRNGFISLKIMYTARKKNFRTGCAMENPTYAQELKQIRLKRYQLWGVFISYLPAIGITLSISEGSAAPAAVCLLWVLFAAIGGVRVSFSRCPRCGNLFHMRGAGTSWGRRCRHCDLSL
jgi:hypothetical protein